jgi:hypothetical protein
MANHGDVASHHDVSKGLGPAQKRGGIQPHSGDAPRPGLRLFDNPTPHDHVHNTVPVRSSDASSWVGPAEVPTRPTRGRVPPNIANDARRKPLIDVTAIVSPSGNSHVASPPPRKL